MVNWCCALETVISDIEVDYHSISTPTKITVPGRTTPVDVGLIHKFAYPLSDGTGEIVVATTRLETMLADTAIAVHPEDERYKMYHGKAVTNPLNGREISIVCDAELVDPTFGTGALKITPAHDSNDYALAKRHALPSINMLNKNGTVNDACGITQLIGMSRFDVRDKVIDLLNQQQLYRGTQPHEMRLGICSRSGDIIEPMMMPQWFISTNRMTTRALDTLNSGQWKIWNSDGELEMRRWLESSRDWCISRQLWWGHRIPAYKLTHDSSKEAWFVENTLKDAQDSAMAYLKHQGLDNNTTWQLEQDEDVLDTWFSSALLPISATNPDANVSHLHDLCDYPTTLLETGQDIIFFWVARMVMLCLQLTDQVPFREVLLHGMVRDAQGRKMSKSLGNVIDPMDVIEGKTLDALKAQLNNGNLCPKEIQRSVKALEKQFPQGIPAYGADALRLTLLEFASSKQINLSLDRVQGKLHLCNKLFNLAKFVFKMADKHHYKLDCFHHESLVLTQLPAVSQYILARLTQTLHTYDTAFSSMELSRASTVFTDFMLQDFADVYVEFAKRLLNSDDTYTVNSTLQVLFVCLHSIIHMAHPFAPFLTQEIYSNISKNPSDMLLDARLQYHNLPPINVAKQSPVEQLVSTMLAVLSAARSIRENNRLQSGTFNLYVDTTDSFLSQNLGTFKNDLIHFTKARAVSIGQTTPPDCITYVISSTVKVYVTMQDTSQSALAPVSHQKLVKHIEKLDNDISKMLLMMQHPGYEQDVPLAVQTQQKKKLDSFRLRREELQKALKSQ